MVKTPNIKPPNLAMQASREIPESLRETLKTHDLEFLCLAQLPERPSEDCSSISASSQNLMFNIQNF